jgi:hypothetical protein
MDIRLMTSGAAWNTNPEAPAMLQAKTPGRQHRLQKFRTVSLPARCFGTAEVVVSRDDEQKELDLVPVAARPGYSKKENYPVRPSVQAYYTSLQIVCNHNSSLSTRRFITTSRNKQN